MGFPLSGFVLLCVDCIMVDGKIKELLVVAFVTYIFLPLSVDVLASLNSETILRLRWLMTQKKSSLLPDIYYHYLLSHKYWSQI